MCFNVDSKDSASVSTETVESPNDPKLSDCGARRGSCVVERRGSIQTTAKGGSEKTGPS